MPRISVILVVWVTTIGVLPGQEASKTRGWSVTAAQPREAAAWPWPRHSSRYALDHIGNRGVGAELSFYSPEQERLIGNRLAKNFESSHRLVSDSTVNAYVNRIAQNIVRHSDATIPVTVKIVNSDEVNAYNVPGGFIYVNSGLILATEDEASLACMLAHEIAHVAARHGVRYLVRSAQLDTPRSWMRFYRDLEREADLLAIEYVYAAGYDPVAFVRFFEKVHRQKLIAVTPDHPRLQERIKQAQLEIATMLPAKTAYLVTTDEFNEIRSRLLALTGKHRDRRSCFHRDLKGRASRQ